MSTIASSSQTLALSLRTALSLDLDLNIDGLGIPLGCDCKPKGSLNNPKFSESKKFLGVTTAEGGFGIAFEGTASSNKIKKGTAVNEFGDSFIYECTLDTACALSTRSGTPYKR
jgi:hypothetical protein